MDIQQKIIKIAEIKPAKKTEKLILIFTLILLFLLLSALLTDGHGWGDDFALYLRQAQNIADGRKYSDTGYIYNTHEPLYSPKAYPPVYPLLLSVVYKIFGLDFLKLKNVSVLFFVLYLGLLFIFFRKRFSFSISILSVILFGLNPAFFIELDQILSDFTFLFFTMFAILLIEKFTEKPAVKSAVLTAVAVWLSYGSRTVGIVLIPAIFLYFVYRHRRITKELILSVSLACFFIFLQKVLLHEGAYFNFGLIFQQLIQTIIYNIGYYAKILSETIVRTNSLPVVLILISLALSGFVIHTFCDRNIDFVFFYCILYFGLLLIFPSIQGPRYIYPLIPFFLMYILYFIQRQQKNFFWIIPVLMVLIIIGYLPEYFQMKAKTGEIPEATNEYATEMYEAIGDLEEGGFYFRKPRALAFFADVSAGLISGDDLNQLSTTISEAERLEIRYFVEDKKHFSRFNTIQELNPDNFSLVYENEGFMVYERLEK